ncbi:hypothetical protein COB57_03300 [Candidatus Peregrinibacteria bacterium]|nr:MAG: hypothetical protein COB57_03300 [Candidatus Peregrinibacteria bacterium]
MHISDEELILLHLDGDINAFPKLAERHQNAIFRFALSLCKSRQDAQDISQNTFVNVYLSLPKSKTHLSFKPWLFTICANLCKNLFRKKKSINFTELEHINNEGEALSIVNTIPDTKEDAQSTLYKKELQEVVKKAIETLPDKYKVIITMRYFDDFSLKEISKILEIPVNTVKTQIKRAKTNLEHHLKHIL